MRIIYRAIEKSRLEKWIVSTLGLGVGLNPHRVAFPLVARVANSYLASLTPPALGIFISDENREIVGDVEKTIRLLGLSESSLKLGQIIEKGFFIDSRTSLPLQLADMTAMVVRKEHEARAGLAAAQSFDAGVFDQISPLLISGDESFTDVISWLTDQEKKEATRDIVQGRPEPAHTGRF